MTSIASRAAKWVASGDTGMSSQAIFAHMLAEEPVEIDRWAHPSDPSDLGRCLRLLALIPEWSHRIGEMAQHGPYWAALVPRWDEMAGTMAAEVGINWSKGSKAPETYRLMKEILDPVTDADPDVIVIGRGVSIRTGERS